MILFSFVLVMLLLGLLLGKSLRTLTRQIPPKQVSYIPPRGQLIFHALPFMAYGGLSISYIFTVQLCGYFGSLIPGWTQEQAVKTLNVVHFLGLVTFIMTQGVAEIPLQRFWSHMQETQKRVSLNNLKETSHFFRGFRSRYLRNLLLSNLAVSVTLGLVTIWSWQAFNLEFTFGPLSVQLLVLSLLGYSLLSWGLFECGLLMALARPWLAARSILIAVILVLVNGLLLSNNWNFKFSMVALVIGGVGLVVCTRSTIRNLLHHPGYVLYQAY
jgi:hypothetical protein